MAAQPPTFRFVDLFAGLGGFHVALRGLGGEGVFAAEWESGLNALYETNFGIAPWSDVNELDTDEVIAEHVPNHEVLTAGFPCQPFSKSGKQQGFEHTLQGHLFFKVHDILRVKRPGRFILENVPNILSHDGGATKATIIEMLVDLGYEVDIRRLSPHQFGIPQVRERAYFVGALISEGGLVGFKWPDESTEETTIATALDPEAPPVREVPERTQDAIDMWRDFLTRAPKDIKLPSFPIWSMEFRASYPYEEMTPPRAWSQRRPGKLDEFTGSFGFPLEGLNIAGQKLLIPSHSRRDGDVEFPGWKRAFIRQNRAFYSDNRKWIDPWLEEWRPWEFQLPEVRMERARRRAGHRRVRHTGPCLRRPCEATDDRTGSDCDDADASADLRSEDLRHRRSALHDPGRMREVAEPRRYHPPCKRRCCVQSARQRRQRESRPQDRRAAPQDSDLTRDAI